MFGGTEIGGWAAPHRAAGGQSAPGWSPTSLALATSVVLPIVMGMALAYGEFRATPEALSYLRRTLNIGAGAIFFGAGLIHLSVRRVDSGSARGQGGLVLVVLGLSAAFLSGQGPVLHASVLPTVLNPLAWALVALATLGALATIRHFAARDTLRTAPVAAAWLAVMAAGFAALVALRELAGVSLDLPPVAQVLLELTVAAMWFLAAVAVTGPDPTLTAGTGADARVLGALGCVWLMRAGAVAEPFAWGFSSAVLLSLVAVVTLTKAMTELTRAAETEHDRVSAAEAALAAAQSALDAAEHHRRDIRHGCRNSMHALRLATQTLALHGERLDTQSRVRLSQAVVAEVNELEQLLRQCAHPSAAASLVRVPAQRERS